MTKEKNRNRKARMKNIIIYIFTFLILYGVVMTSFYTKKYTYEIGDVVKSDIIAPRDVENSHETNLRRESAKEAVQDQYDKDLSVKENALKEINNFFQDFKSLKDKESSQENFTLAQSDISALTKDISLKITLDEATTLLKLSKNDIISLEEVLETCIDEIGQKNIKDSTGIDEAINSVNIELNNSNFSREIRAIAVNLIKPLIKKNYVYSEEKTEALREEEQKKVQPVMIKKDQIIVRGGDLVTESQLSILSDLGILNNSSSSGSSSTYWLIYVSIAVLLISILALQRYYLKKYKVEVYREYKKLVLINLMVVFAVALTKVLYLIPYLIPFAVIPLLMTLLFDEQISLIINLFTAVLVATTLKFNINVSIVFFIQITLSIMFMRRVQQRNDIIKNAIIMGIISSVISIAIGILVNNDLLTVLKNTGMVMVGATLGGILTIGILPLLENAFGIITNIKLLELSNPNIGLMKKLIMETPGTYQHSLMVANLAEQASEVVGANPILARVGAYYHDVGKTERPYFFKENQISIENPHDNLEPNVSAQIIISHVEKGVELAKKAGLPEDIISIIKQHHGNDLVKYFYITMKNKSENPDKIDKADYQYKGPIPSSKESAIVMLSDGVEAGVRSLKEPTKENIEKMIENIIKARVNEGQLEDCDLTFKDIKTIQETFLKTLTSVYHQRIEYPKDNTIDKEEKAT